MGEDKAEPLEGWVLYVTNHFTHLVVEAQAASPRYHLARKLSERGQRLLVYCPIGTHEGNPLRDFVANLRPRKISQGTTTYLFPPLLVTPSSVGTIPTLVFGTLFILLYLWATRLKVSAQYCTTTLVGTVSTVVRKVLGIPLVANYGDPDFARETGLARRAFGFCENLVLGRGNAYAVVYVDENIGKYVRERFGVSRTVFLPNGGYEAGFVPPAKGSEEVRRLVRALDLAGKRPVVYVGQISHTYRLDLLLSVAEETSGHEEIVFVLAGTGAALPSLRAEVAKRRLEERFRFVGAVRYDKVPAYLAAAEVGLQLLPDMCMGTKVLMYMSNRLPVVSVGGWYDRYGEFLRDGENAILLPPKSGDLSRELVALLSDPSRLRRLGEAGWESAKPFTWDRHADVTLSLLREAGQSAGR
ncbi:MAG TPA: glycosyltransferase family 4 protein [Nitrososphaerales archaeon]|nr:glycosyltransferase family 4 protein [Nitrososphaerales archaeon]